MNLSSTYAQLINRKSLLSFPDEILLKIFSEFALSDWTSDGIGWGPRNPFLMDCGRREALDRRVISTRYSLSLVSKLFHALTTRLLWEFVHIRDVRRLHALVRSPELCNVLARYTRRMDILLLEEPAESSDWTSNDWDPDERPITTPARLARTTPPESAYRATGAILRHCTSLTHLTICIFYEPSADGHPFGNMLIDSCPSLQVLSWRFAPKVAFAPLLHNMSADLRVLDVSNVALFCAARRVDVAELPRLHTLKGAVDILIPALHGVRLPSMSRLIFDFHKDKNFSDANLRETSNEFFRKYGPQITTFVSYSDKIIVDLDTMPNLRELAFCISDTQILSRRTGVAKNLVHIGFVGSHGSQCARPCCFLTNLSNPVVGNCKTILSGREGKLFPSLKTVQIISAYLAYNLRCNHIVSEAIAEKFVATGVRLLDEDGDEFTISGDPRKGKKKSQTKRKTASSNRARCTCDACAHCARSCKSAPGRNTELGGDSSRLVTEQRSTIPAREAGLLVQKFEFTFKLGC